MSKPARSAGRPSIGTPSNELVKAPSGRVCGSENCATILSIYNPSDFCSGCKRNPRTPRDKVSAHGKGTRKKST